MLNKQLILRVTVRVLLI